MEFITVYVTHKNTKEAKRVAELLLKERLIACVNYFPITSTYWWKNKITSSKEVVTLLKTQKKLWKKLERRILDIHPYETPCIIKYTVTANDSYSTWIKNETK